VGTVQDIQRPSLAAARETVRIARKGHLQVREASAIQVLRRPETPSPNSIDISTASDNEAIEASGTLCSKLNRYRQARVRTALLPLAVNLQALVKSCLSHLRPRLHRLLRMLRNRPETENERRGGNKVLLHLPINSNKTSKQATVGVSRLLQRGITDQILSRRRLRRIFRMRNTLLHRNSMMIHKHCPT